MKLLISAIVLMASVLSQAQAAAPLDSKLKIKLQQEIEYVGSIYGTVYAPKAWKESHNGWNLPAEIQLAQAKLAAAQNLHEAREAVAGLIKSTADYHVSYAFYSTEKAIIPFQVKTVEGKTLIVYIDRTKLSETAFPFKEGDEVLTMDQVPVGQIFSEIIKVLGLNIPETDQALADIYLTRRSARANMNVPQGPVTLAIKRSSDNTVGTVTLFWDYTPEKLIQNNNIPFALLRDQSTLMHKKMLAGAAVQAKEMADQAENNFGLGEKKPFLPDFGPRVWSAAADSSFDAYIFQNEAGQLIGVLRIPQYIVDDYKKAAKDFSEIIAHMQENTSALIIDQNNNPGGSVFYLYSLVSMLSDQAMSVPTHRVALQNSEAKECLDTLDQLKDVKSDDDAQKIFGDNEGFPATLQLAVGITDYCNNFIKQYQAGKTVSDPLHLWGVDKITPNAVHYTKPIVLLVNSLDFSGGDFFPAIMQDNKRATIVGVRTAGAGGFIIDANFPNSYGLEMISFTGSIAERLNNNPIENLGVTPDVALPMTAEDIRNGFKAYQTGVKNVVTDLLKGSSSGN